MYSRANQDPQLISLTTKTSVYNDLLVPPHSGEKPINKVREAGKVINKGYQTQCRLTSKCHMTELSLTICCFNNSGVRTEDNTVIHEKTHAVLFASNEYFFIFFCEYSKSIF